MQTLSLRFRLKINVLSAIPLCVVELPLSILGGFTRYGLTPGVGQRMYSFLAVKGAFLSGSGQGCLVASLHR